MNLITKIKMQGTKLNQKSYCEENSEFGIVSFHSKVPKKLNHAMKNFIELHPNWDQYRLIKAALAGFLVQNGVESRQLTRLYVSNMFKSN